MIITGFQLRAGKKVLNLTLKQLSTNCCVSKVTLGRLINTTNNTNEISCSAQDAEKIITFFYNKKIIFPNKTTITLDQYVAQKELNSNLTRFQFVAARVALNLSQKNLVKYVELSHTSFQRFEKQNNECYLSSNKLKISDLILFFHQNNITFPDNKSVKIEK